MIPIFRYFVPNEPRRDSNAAASGMGRTHAPIFGSAAGGPTFHQFLPFMLLADFLCPVPLASSKPSGWFFWLVASAIIAFTCNSPLLHIWQRMRRRPDRAVLPLTFAWASTRLWFALLLPRPALPSEVVLLTSAGNDLKVYEKFPRKR